MKKIEWREEKGLSFLAIGLVDGTPRFKIKEATLLHLSEREMRRPVYLLDRGKDAGSYPVMEMEDAVRKAEEIVQTEQPKPTQDSCGSCMFCIQDVKELSSYGCRRYPHVETVFLTWWCGEFKRRETCQH